MKKIIKKLSLLLFGIIFSFYSISSLYAASASISVSSSSSKVVVGNTFTVTYKVSSSTALGSWKFVPTYDKNRFKLVSGDSTLVGYASNKTTKSKSYTYKFKAIGTGTGTISLKSAEVYSYDEKWMSVSSGKKSVTVITQAQLEASYSKNNNLKSLSIDGLTLSPKFNKGTTSYTVQAGANTTKVKINAKAEDSKSKVSGAGTHNVSEGENKFKIVVTAQNGTTKTYTVIVNVVDPNPIEVTINDQKYTIVKRESSLDPIDGFTKSSVTINDQKIPTLYNEINNYNLVGLKDAEGNIEYYIYNSENNSYVLYEDSVLTQMKIFPLEIDRTFQKEYEKTTITIEDVKYEALKLNADGLYIIHARDLNTAVDGYYQYDSKTNTMIRFIEEKIKVDTYKDEKIAQYKKIILLLGIETIIIIMILIGILVSKIRNNKKRKKELEEKRKVLEENKEIEVKEKKKASTKKKEVLTNEAKKKKNKKI